MTLTEIEPMTSLDVEHLCDIRIDFEPAQIFATPMGTRIIAVVRHGTIEGPRLRGEFLPGGGDWMVAGTDRIGRLDVRATFRTDDGELVFFTATGRACLPDDALSRFYTGELIGVDEMYTRTAPLFETGAQKYRWLNGVVAIGFNQLSLTSVDYRVYRVS